VSALRGYDELIPEVCWPTVHAASRPHAYALAFLNRRLGHLDLVILKVETVVVLQGEIEHDIVPWYERQVCDGTLPTDKPVLAREHALEDTEDTKNLFAVSLDRAGKLLVVQVQKPG